MNDHVIYTWDDMKVDVDLIAAQVDTKEFKPDMIVGIMRGGIVPAVMLSHKMNCPVTSLYWSKRDYQNREFGKFLDDIVKSALSGKRYLIIDDIVDSGETVVELQQYASTFANAKFYTNYIKFAALIYNRDQSAPVDYYGRSISRNVDKRWIVFPWESNS